MFTDEKTHNTCLFCAWFILLSVVISSSTHFSLKVTIHSCFNKIPLCLYTILYLCVLWVDVQADSIS